MHYHTNLIAALLLAALIHEGKKYFQRPHQTVTYVCTITYNLLTGSAIWCYRCTSATPGCAEKFNWRGIGFLGEHCPEPDDICVKVTERRGGKRKSSVIRASLTNETRF